MSASTCPRCKTALTSFAPAARPDGTPLEIDRCDRCGGLWLDGPEVAAVAPALAQLEGRNERRSGGTGIESCPCCGSGTVECDAQGVQVDLCSYCKGVWLDGGELEALRQRAASAGSPADSVSCQGCGATVARRATAITGRGLLCASCEEAFGAMPQERPAEASASRSSEAASGFFAGLEFLGAFVELIASIAQAFA